MSKLRTIVLVPFLLCPLVAAAQGPKEVVAHHLTAFQKHDLNALMADYARDAVLVFPTGTHVGSEDIRKSFESLFAVPATGRDTSSGRVRPQSSTNIPVATEEELNDGVVLLKSGGGRIEVFVVRNEKIAFQALQSSGLPPPLKAAGSKSR